MATATDRAAIGAEEARMEGKGPGGRAAEAAKNAVTDRDQRAAGPFNDGTHDLAGRDGTHVGDRGLFNHHHHDNGEMLGHTEEEMARLRNHSHVTYESEAYCPNPNIRDLPKEFETRVQVIQRYPEMKTVEKTDFVKEIHHEERTIIVPKTRMIYDEVEIIDRVPVVKQVPKSRMEIVYRVVEEEREVTDMVPVVEYMDVPRIERVPRVITEDVEEKVTIPVVREVPVTRMVEVPTGNYCEAPVGEFINPGDFDLLHHKHDHHHHHHSHHHGGDKLSLSRLLNRTTSASSSSSSDDGSTGRDAGMALHNADGTTNHAGQKKKSGLLQRIIHH